MTLAMEETAGLLRELDGLIDGDRYFPSERVKTPKAIRSRDDLSDRRNGVSRIWLSGWRR
jgi:hypothetical protein